MLRNGRMKPALLQMVLAALVLAAVPASGQQQPDGLIDVDLQLVLAVDVSGSIDEMEARLQRDGYVQAMRDPFVIQAIGNGPHGRIAVAYTEWAGPLSQTLVVNWHVIDGQTSAGVFARRLQEAPVGTGQRTSISSAILHAVPLFRKGGFRAVRKVIDISGDGANNGGFHVHHTRYRALENGITINGLPIMNNRPSPLGLPATEDIDLYYEDCVIVGPGAFIVVAETIESFAAAVRRKMILEIAGQRPPERRSRSGIVPVQFSHSLTDCTIGEKAYELFRRRQLLR